ASGGEPSTGESIRRARFRPLGVAGGDVHDGAMSQHHILRAGPETCHWGVFDAALEPVLAIRSGDTVTLDSISGGPDTLPRAPEFEILPELRAVHAQLAPRLPGHILTGPIAIEGARPGDVLQADILSIELRQNWAYSR